MKAYNDLVLDNTIFGITEKQIEKTITRELRKLGIPIEYSKISMADKEGIIINIEFDRGLHETV